MVGKSVGHSSTSLIDGVCFQNRNPARLPQKDKPEWQYRETGARIGLHGLSMG